MEKIRDISEALTYLKQGDLLTGNGNDRFLYKNEKIHVYDEGTHFVLSEEDFMELYASKRFYLYEESAEIDETKDEAYYRFYRK